MSESKWVTDDDRIYCDTDTHRAVIRMWDDTQSLSDATIRVYFKEGVRDEPCIHDRVYKSVTAFSAQVIASIVIESHTEMLRKIRAVLT